MHQAGGHQRPLFAGVDSDRLALFEKEEGWQGTARFHASRGDELGRLENVQGRKVAIFRFAFVDVCQGGIGGAQVDADFHASSSLREGRARCYSNAIFTFAAPAGDSRICPSSSRRLRNAP